MRRILIIPVRNAEGEGPAYITFDAAGFSFNFCTYMCEMTLRDKDGEEVRDENGYVTLMDDGFSWGAAALTGSTRALMTTPGVRRSTGRTASGSARRGRYRPRRHGTTTPPLAFVTTP